MVSHGRIASPSATSAAADARIVFQPIVDLEAWSVVGFEALARFADGTPPPQRLAEAEAAGLRGDLELALISLAVDATTGLPDDLVITMNASGTTMLRDELPSILSRADRPWGLELYEGATRADLPTIRRRVHDLGGKLLVDDAGAACADEARIRTLQPDVVKIDRALFWEVSADSEARARMLSLLAAARDAGARLLVEGVSDEQQVALARELGIRLAQGFHLGLPTPAAEMADQLRELRGRVGVDAPGL
ncbi:EAL domain-containing protein [Microbacterium sp. NPDC055903]